MVMADRHHGEGSVSERAPVFNAFVLLALASDVEHGVTGEGLRLVVPEGLNVGEPHFNDAADLFLNGLASLGNEAVHFHGLCEDAELAFPVEAVKSGRFEAHGLHDAHGVREDLFHERHQ